MNKFIILLIYMIIIPLITIFFLFKYSNYEYVDLKMSRKTKKNL